MHQKIKQATLIMGAAFLMATSAVGPGFLTQTTVFTQQLGASFGFVVLVSILLDIGAQLNIWRIVVVSKEYAQDIANQMLPGLGIFIAVLVALGGFAFNIGNISGAGLGINVIFPNISPITGAIISAVIAISIFLLKDASRVMDKFTIIMGSILIILMVYILFSTNPPIKEALYRSFVPLKVDMIVIVTLVGGTVGGYITFSGAHRLIDAGIMGKEALPKVSQGSISAIGIASLVRIILFLVVLGVLSQGAILNPDNPVASVFQFAAGNLGEKIFGVLLWTVSITSVIGAAYTSVSFLKTLHPFIAKYQDKFVILFIIASTLVFAIVGKPILLLLIVGAVNGFILPITLGVMLIAANQRKIVGDYKHSKILSIIGWFIVVIMIYMSFHVISTLFFK